MLENELRQRPSICEKLYVLWILNSMQIGATSSNDREAHIEDFNNRVEEAFSNYQKGI